MKGRIVTIQYYYEAGTTQMYKLPQLVNMEIIEVLQEQGTDRMFGYIGDKLDKLVYIGASCIGKFVN